MSEVCQQGRVWLQCWVFCDTPVSFRIVENPWRGPRKGQFPRRCSSLSHLLYHPTRFARAPRTRPPPRPSPLQPTSSVSRRQKSLLQYPHPLPAHLVLNLTGTLFLTLWHTLRHLPSPAKRTPNSRPNLRKTWNTDHQKTAAENCTTTSWTILELRRMLAPSARTTGTR